MKWTIDDKNVCTMTLSLAPNNEIGTEMLNFFEKFFKEVKTSELRALIIHSSLESGFCAGAHLFANCMKTWSPWIKRIR